MHESLGAVNAETCTDRCAFSGPYLKARLPRLAMGAHAIDLVTRSPATSLVERSRLISPDLISPDHLGCDRGGAPQTRLQFFWQRLRDRQAQLCIDAAELRVQVGSGGRRHRITALMISGRIAHDLKHVVERGYSAFQRLLACLSGHLAYCAWFSSGSGPLATVCHLEFLILNQSNLILASCLCLIGLDADQVDFALGLEMGVE